MEFLNKIEAFINKMLIKLGELIWNFVLKMIPAPIKDFIKNFKARIKSLPAVLKNLLIKIVKNAKTNLLSFNYKAALQETYQKALTQYKETSAKHGSGVKKIFLIPFLMVSQWLQGLTAVQTLLLLTCTGASFLAIVGIGFSGHRMVKGQGNDRFPASVEVEVEYERPVYYKKETKHFEVTNFRLPVYIPQVNEVKSVDIDFIATLSNRAAKQFLEKHEFQLRDFLILQIEPSVASFPLEEEGKEIIRRKLLTEINDYLRNHEVEGEVVEMKITYTLAN